MCVYTSIYVNIYLYVRMYLYMYLCQRTYLYKFINKHACKPNLASALVLTSIIFASTIAPEEQYKVMGDRVIPIHDNVYLTRLRRRGLQYPILTSQKVTSTKWNQEVNK
jgi:hypothetical protein